MSDSQDFGDRFYATQTAFPVPPDPDPEARQSWWTRNADTVRELGFGTLSSACALAPFGFGGDMTLIVIILSAGWILGSIALWTWPQKTIVWRAVAIFLLFAFFCIETGFLYWHFHGLPHLEWLDRLDGKTESTFAKFTHVPPPVGVPPPPTSWVTQEEIEAQRKLGRLLLNYSPKELLDLWGSGGNIGAYLNKWIKIDCAFPNNGLTVEPLNKKQYDVVKVVIQRNFISAALSAYFDRKKWDEKLVLLRPKGSFKAICQFDRIDRTEPTKGWPLDTLVAVDCDLL
jgi:hypothetical protein